MNPYYPTGQPTIAPNIMVRKQRRLPVAGDILVRVGTRVEPEDVVARAVIPGTPQPLALAAPLGVRPGAGARYLAKPVGSQFEDGEVLASRRQGLRRRTVVRSPAAGTLTAYDARTGEATFTPTGATFELQAYINGIVTEHIPYRGVVIDTPAALVRGIAGLGGEQHGVLQVAVADANEELVADQITARLAYSIVLGGSTTTAAALRRAIEHNVRAIIVGSIPAAELRAFLDYPDGRRGWTLGRTGWTFPPPPVSAGAVPPPPLTLVIVEGFGQMPMTTKAWELLAAHDGQEVAVDGTTRLRGGLTRPEVVVPLARTGGVAPFEATPPPAGIRSLVRLLAPPFVGQTGRVQALSPGRQPIESGLRAAAAEVELKNGLRVWVPLLNLEVLE